MKKDHLRGGLLWEILGSKPDPPDVKSGCSEPAELISPRLGLQI